jgi:hypothetical protein
MAASAAKYTDYPQAYPEFCGWSLIVTIWVTIWAKMATELSYYLSVNTHVPIFGATLK